MYLRICLSILICLTVPAHAEQGASGSQGDASFKELKTRSVFKGLMYQVWGRLRSLNPKVGVDEASGRRLVATAGIRGSETTDTVLKPYWKDDRTSDPEFLEQVRVFNDAQAMVETGKLLEGAESFGSFIKQYPGSTLIPNAQLAQGLALGAEGKTDESLRILRSFAADYPQHPMKVDADQIIAMLTGAQ